MASLNLLQIFCPSAVNRRASKRAHRRYSYQRAMHTHTTPQRYVYSGGAQQEQRLKQHHAWLDCQFCCKDIASPRFAEFCERSTWHGVPDVSHARTNKPLMFFWILAIIIAFLAATFGCYRIINQYLISPVVISYTVRPGTMAHEDDPNLTRTSGKRLPDVIVCPFNRFNETKVNKYNISNELLEYIDHAFTITTPYPFNDHRKDGLPPNASKYEEQLGKVMMRHGNITFFDLLDDISYDCNGIIERCVVPSGAYNCCDEAVGIMTVVGKCFRMKGQAQQGAGYSFGMTMMIKLPDKKYLSKGANNIHDIGVCIKLAEEKKGSNNDLTFIPGGVHALVPLRSTFYKFINKPPSYECFEHVESSYSEVQCFDDCFFMPGVEECQCVQISSPANMSYRRCTPLEFTTCLIGTTLATLHETGPELYVETCQKRCKPACNYWEYQPTVSYAKFPSETFFFYVPESQRSHYEDYIVLDVFYEKLEYTLIKHLPSMTPDEFIANIGGQLGLWVGGSILSVIQIMVFICHYLLAKCCGGEKRRRSHDPFVSNAPCCCHLDHPNGREGAVGHQHGGRFGEYSTQRHSNPQLVVTADCTPSEISAFPMSTSFSSRSANPLIDSGRSKHSMNGTLPCGHNGCTMGGGTGGHSHHHHHQQHPSANTNIPMAQMNDYRTVYGHDAEDIAPPPELHTTTSSTAPEMSGLLSFSPQPTNPGWNEPQQVDSFHQPKSDSSKKAKKRKQRVR